MNDYRAFVHVDNDGPVRSPMRYKALQAVGYAVAGSVVAGVTGVYGALLGPPGVLIGLGHGAYLAWHVRRGRRLQEAVTLVAHDPLDSGNREFAWHLLREAFDRHRQLHLKEGMPLLHNWMEANAQAPGVDLTDLAEGESSDD